MQKKERRRCSENIPARIIIYEQTTFYLSSTLCIVQNQCLLTKTQAVPDLHFGKSFFKELQNEK